MENGRFRKITQRSIHGIKNQSIWISNRGETKLEEISENWKNMNRN